MTTVLYLLKKCNLYKNYSNLTRSFSNINQYFIVLGQKYHHNCKKTPVTCQLIEELSAARSCRRGQVKFSIMEGGTHVWPHCGPTNCRLRAHLGLVVPPGAAIRVANDTRY